LIDIQGCLPDPRRYGAGDHTLLQLAGDDLRRELEKLLRGGLDADITLALRAASSRADYVRLWQAVSDVAHHAGDTGEPAVVARIFALPLVIVTGSRRAASVPGVLPDIAAVRTLFEQHCALGRTRNFGLSNALCSSETLDRVTPGEVYVWASATGGAPRDLAPSDIMLEEPGEKVHLRFLVGAGITPAAEPSFVETSSNIGAWGMPLTRLLAVQLGQPGIEVLPLARPPLDLLRAAHAGRVAQLEAAFNLFASNAVRHFRAGTGDPVAVIGTHDDAELRVSLSSPFDDTTVEGFRWPLHPLDDIGQITGSIVELLGECRVSDVQFVGRILPALNAQGQVRFVSARDLPELEQAGLPH
jgi:hypothetical protein